MTLGLAFIAANDGRSSGRQSRRMRRGVSMVGEDFIIVSNRARLSVKHRWIEQARRDGTPDAVR